MPVEGLATTSEAGTAPDFAVFRKIAWRQCRADRGGPGDLARRGRDQLGV
jgi:hypothetical protein